MSISHSLSNALSGLTATSRMAEVVSSNLSNVLTEGYGRRVVNLSAQDVGGRGAGVTIDGISRVVDRTVLAERRLADADLGRSITFAEALTSLESLIGKPDDPSSLAGRVAALEASLASAAGDPTSDLFLSDALDKFKSVAKGLNEDQAGISNLRQQADADIADQVSQLNTSLKQIETLNADITKAKAMGTDPSALMDQRQVAIDKISAIVPVKELDRADGRIALMTVSGEMLIDGPAPTYEFAASGIIMPHMTLSAGMLSGITKDGVSMGADGFGRLSGGSLEATFTLRDETLVEAQTTLDALARDLLERFADPATDPTVGAGQPGLFTDAGLAFDPLDEVGLAGRIAVNPAVDPTQGGALSRLRDGVGATTAGPIGNATQIDAWIGALSQSRTLSTGGTASSFAGNVSKFASAISMSRVNADEEVAFSSARWSTLREAELADGVDTDQEMQMLLKIEQAYAANAKVVQTIDDMIRRLMEI
ncbi:flagellar hook-associated protein FlgK [Flavimaricola marinus]|uniref:Flagellar hook-associated protein 1 n=1 Tax=Flavimaricola marinus TaxID=1819565 RepID=A0A238LF63_9RHOB|nr:flagellar hook-associated protein FlgK [Flavimaricola marinus]SMY08213.1 Flagellar hook-associated protein 1 [Flavimaricola marinus]